MRIVAAANEPIAIYDLSKMISDLEGTKRETIYISLHQSHLPSLDEYGVVVYHPGRSVAPTAECKVLRAIDDCVRDCLDQECPLQQASKV